MISDDYPPVLNTEQVAELLMLDIDTVRRLARDERLPAHRLPGGRSFRFLRDELLEWLRRQPANNPAPGAQPKP